MKPIKHNTNQSIIAVARAEKKLKKAAKQLRGYWTYTEAVAEALDNIKLRKLAS